MFTTEVRMQKLLTSNPKTLARIDAILMGEDSTSGKADPDCRTCTFTEAARRLGVSRPTLYRMTERGAIRTIPLNGVSRVVIASLIDYVSNAEKARGIYNAGGEA